MKNLILISIVSLFSITLVGQNKIEWSSDYKLAKEDYKAEAPNSGKQQTVLGSFFVGFQVANYTLMTTKNLNKAVSCYFQKDASYIDKGDSVSTAELLRYQQLIFNTYEINARYLRQKFFEERKRLLWEGPNILQEEVTKKHSKLLSQIERETNHGSNLDKIEEWELRIKSELESLSDYSKNGRPKKKNKKK